MPGSPNAGHRDGGRHSGVGRRLTPIDDFYPLEVDMSKRDAYVDKVKATIDEWNAEIDRLEGRANEVEAATRLRYQEQIRELRRQRDEARSRLARAEAASEEAWEDMRSGFEEAWDRLTDGFRKAMRRFR